MQYTSNFNFNLPEGTDLWNYLTQTNPNFTALDTLLKSIQDGTVTTATEVTSGTAHAVTRTLPDANVIRFTATGVWTLGDTMTIDGTPVTVVKPNGTSLQTGDYIIGSEVLGILRATQFTVYVGGGSSTMDAEDVDYDNTVSGLTATDVQAAIDEEAAAISTINSNLTNKFVSGSAITTLRDNTSPLTTPYSYTATEDCIIFGQLQAYANSAVSVTVDNVAVFAFADGGTSSWAVTPYLIPLKAGSTITIALTSGSNGNAIVLKVS